MIIGWFSVKIAKTTLILLAERYLSGNVLGFQSGGLGLGSGFFWNSIRSISGYILPCEIFFKRLLLLRQLSNFIFQSIQGFDF